MKKLFTISVLLIIFGFSGNAQTAYITTLMGNKIYVINVPTNTIYDSITVGTTSFCVSVSSDGSKVYVTNNTSNTVSVINTSTNTVSATIPVGISPSGISVSPDGSKVYVANFNSNSVSVINTTTNNVSATIPVGTYPFGISVSPDGSKVYVTNSATNKNIKVINTATNTISDTIIVGTTPNGVTVSPDGSKVYVTNANSNTVSVINASTNNVTATISTSGPDGVSVSPDGSKVYVTNWSANTVSVINSATNTITATITVDSNPFGVSVSPDGSKVYVTNRSSNTVSVINTATNTVSATITIGPMPCSFGNFISNYNFTVTVPTVTTNTISNIAQTIATGGGNVTNDGGASVSSRGVCWSTSQNPTISCSHTTDGTGTGSFVSSIMGMTQNTTYYVRAYATNTVGTAYGSQISFTTLPSAPSVTTTAISNTTQTTAIAGGNVTSDGGASVTARGVCWSTSQNPLVTGSHTNDGIGTGTFSSSVNGLTANTLYYVRAYATNVAGTAYGSQISLFTLQNISVPVVTSNTISNIAQTTATCGGNVTSDGGTSVTFRGVCWNTSQNPTTSNSHTTDGTGTGIFTSNITGLTANTMYYVRAYAINNSGTAYGSQMIFTTLQNVIVIPTVTTDLISNITQTTATGGGNVINDGGATVTSKGICWNTTSNPTINDSYTYDGLGNGSFISNITGLTPGTVYFVRAYAINSSGTAYGYEQQFSTANPIPEPNIDVSPTSMTFFEGDGAKKSENNYSPLPYKVMNDDILQDLENGGQATRVIIPQVVTDNWRNKMLNKYGMEKTTSLSWSGYDTPVRNQESCGSCWAFAAIGLLENIANQAGLGQQDLSEQVVVSCVPNNCNGGWPKKAFNYVKDNGIIPENCFPYTHTNNVCGNECSTPSEVFKITNYEPSLWSTNPTVSDLKMALQQGPLTVSFKVFSGFNSYNNGIYNYQSGSYSGNHAVLLVGYNDNQQYFKVKNSWGENWGENGYFRIAYDDVTDDPKFGSNASYAEGIYLVGSSPPSAGMFTITNTGDAVLEINDIAVNKTWLDINPQTVSPLAPGASIDIIATLSDWNALTASDIATITITSNDPDEPVTEVNITAEKLTGASIPELLVSTEFYQDAELPNTNSSFTIDVDAIKEDSAVVNWKAHTNDAWLTITDTSGVNAGVVIVNYNTNNTGSSRMGYISITSEDVSNSPQIICVTQGINQAPVISDVTKNISNLSDSVYFSAPDFTNQFTDADGNTLQLIRIVSPPDSGILKLNNEPIVAYQTIFLNDIPNLVFVPNTSWTGNSSFVYNASDGMNFSGSNANVNFSFTTNVNAEISESIFIYPNPVTNNLQIQTDLKIVEIEIIDITGRLLCTTTSKTIDCSNYAKGIYFIKVETVNGIAIKKFVKE